METSMQRTHRAGIRLSDAAPMIDIPADYTGLVTLAGSNRLVYWTGKVAIGLQYERPTRTDMGQHAAANQDAPFKTARLRAASASTNLSPRIAVQAAPSEVRPERAGWLY